VPVIKSNGLDCTLLQLVSTAFTVAECTITGSYFLCYSKAFEICLVCTIAARSTQDQFEMEMVLLLVGSVV
jgi:hypothetical protein